MKTLGQLGKLLRSKRNFMIYSVISVGLPGAVGLVWMFGRHGGGILFSLFLVLVAFFSACLWGLLMWEVFMKGFSHRQAKREANPHRD